MKDSRFMKRKCCISLWIGLGCFFFTTKKVEMFMTPVFIGVSQPNKLHLFLLLFHYHLSLIVNQKKDPFYEKRLFFLRNQL